MNRNVQALFDEPADRPEVAERLELPAPLSCDQRRAAHSFVKQRFPCLQTSTAPASDLSNPHVSNGGGSSGDGKVVVAVSDLSLCTLRSLLHAADVLRIYELKNGSDSPQAPSLWRGGRGVTVHLSWHVRPRQEAHYPNL